MCSYGDGVATYKKLTLQKIDCACLLLNLYIATKCLCMAPATLESELWCDI